MFTFTFTGGGFVAGDEIEYELKEGETLLASGSITEEPLEFTIDLPGFDPNTHCYLVRWRKKCSFGGLPTEWQEKIVGNCDLPPENEIKGVFKALLYPESGCSGVKMIIDFEAPTPGPITFRAGHDIKATSSLYVNHSSGYPPPATYAAYNEEDCGFTRDPPFGPGPQTIPAGTSHYELCSICNEPRSSYSYVEKIIFYEVVLPTGYSLTLYPDRSNLSYEIR